MVITNIGLSKVLSYYLDTDKSKEFLARFVKYCEYYEDRNDKLVCKMLQDDKIFDIFKEYSKKLHRNTKSNSYEYEYELDIPASKDDKVFILNTSDHKYFKCEFHSIQLENRKMYIKFNIIKD